MYKTFFKLDSILFLLLDRKKIIKQNRVENSRNFLLLKIFPYCKTMYVPYIFCLKILIAQNCFLCFKNLYVSVFCLKNFYVSIFFFLLILLFFHAKLFHRRIFFSLLTYFFCCMQKNTYLFQVNSKFCF